MASNDFGVDIETTSFCNQLLKPSKMKTINLAVKPLYFLVVAILFAVCFIYILINNRDCQATHIHSQALSVDDKYKVWPTFRNEFQKSSEWYKSRCFGDKFKEFNIAILYDVVQQWHMSPDPDCRALYSKFRTIYSVRQRSGGVIIPKSFEPKVRKWLGGNDELFKETSHQTITLVYNELSNEQTIFNPIRAKRPIKRPEEPEREYIEKMQAQAKDSCDFCKYKEFTAEDVFERIENKYAFSAANTFKYDSFHSLFIPRQHHPLNWGMDDLLGMFDAASKWFDKVHSIDNNYVYPLMIWDLNVKAGASQIHPHTHGSMDTGRYYGQMERWRRSAQEYFDLRGGDVNYFTDQMEIHNALGLAVRHGSAAAYASITPKKDNEVVILAPEADEDFFKMIYYVTRAYIDDMEMLTYSAGVAFPQLGSGPKRGKIPAFARFITRGAVAEIRSDISSLELFAASQVNRDPFKVIKFIKESIEKRAGK